MTTPLAYLKSLLYYVSESFTEILPFDYFFIKQLVEEYQMTFGCHGKQLFILHFVIQIVLWVIKPKYINNYGKQMKCLQCLCSGTVAFFHLLFKIFIIMPLFYKSIFLPNLWLKSQKYKYR